MKPVDKGASPGRFTNYKRAKPTLLQRLGRYCSYCEVFARAQNLDVEHIYPQKAHPELELLWDNFLIACNTCNTYKRHHQGRDRHNNLEQDYLWPHLDNTFRAYEYHDDGQITVSVTLAKEVAVKATNTIKMAGLNDISNAADNYEADVLYDSMANREEIWDIAEEVKSSYLAANGIFLPSSLARQAGRMGYFSIWMAVFHDRPEVREELIKAFRADPACFDIDTQPVRKGQV